MARARRPQGVLGLLLAGVVALGGCDGQYVVGATGLLTVPSPRVDAAPTAVALADLDGDGALDAALLGDGTQVCTLRGHNDATLTAAVCVPLAEPAAALGLSMLRAPGQTELLTAGRALTVYTVQPDLTPSSPLRYPLTGSATALLPAYVKCDGRRDRSGCQPDVLLSDGAAAEVAVFYTNPDGSLRGPQRFPAGDRPTALLYADLDGDGAAELITVNQGAVPLTILGPRGVATFTGCSGGRTAPALIRPSAAAALDLDHDGSRVLIVADEQAASLRLLRVARSGPFTLDCGDAAAAQLPVPPDPLALATADLDADGNEDLLIAHGTPSEVSVLRGGPGGLAAPIVHPVGSALRGLSTGDLDRDGRPDVVVASSGDATVYILRSAFR